MFSVSALGAQLVFPVCLVHACHFMWVCRYQLVFMLLDFFLNLRLGQGEFPSIKKHAEMCVIIVW